MEKTDEKNTYLYIFLNVALLHFWNPVFIIYFLFYFYELADWAF